MAEEAKATGLTIEGAKDAKLFRCKMCTTEQQEAWWSWNEAKKLPIDADRAALFCPTCNGQFGIYSLKNGVDLNKVKVK